MVSFLGHLVFDDRDNRCKYRARYATACSLTDKRPDVDRTRGVGEQRNKCPEQLPANAAANCTGDSIASRPKADILGRRASYIAADCTGDDLNNKVYK